MHPLETVGNKQEQLLDELADILFEQWLQEVNQTRYNEKDETCSTPSI